MDKEGSASGRYKNLMRNVEHNKAKLFDEGGLPDGDALKAALDMARGVISRPYSPGDWNNASEEPFRFDGDAYDLDKAGETQVHREMAQVADSPSIKGKDYIINDAANDEELKQEIAALS